MTVVPFQKPLYEAKRFEAGRFASSGTLCGHVDLVGVSAEGTCICLSPDEITDLISVLTRARTDVLQNSDPFNDPRLYEVSV